MERKDELLSTRKRLWDEYNSLREQRLAILNELNRHRDGAVVSGSAAYGKPGLPSTGLGADLKRQALSQPTDARDLKRQKQTPDVDKQIQNLLARCGTILKDLMGKKDATPFRVPVNTVQYHDYLTLVPHPMDLGTISERLKNHYYKHPNEFRDDVRLVWKNCRAYNAEGHFVRLQGDKLSEFFEQRWATLEPLMQQLSAATAGGGMDVPKKIKDLDDELRLRLGHRERQQGREAPDINPRRDMTFEEKRKLSVLLGSLQGDRLAAVLDIVAENIDQNSDQEMELDIDSLDNHTLWKLYQFVMSASNPSRQPPGQEQSSRPRPNGVHVKDEDGDMAAATSQPARAVEGSADSTGGSQEGLGSTAVGLEDQARQARGGGAEGTGQDMSAFVSTTRPVDRNLYSKAAANVAKKDQPKAALNVGWSSLPTDIPNGKGAAQSGPPQDDLFQALAPQTQKVRERVEEEERQKAEKEKKEAERQRQLRDREEKEAEQKREAARVLEEERKIRDEQRAKHEEELRLLRGTARMTDHAEYVGMLEGVQGDQYDLLGLSKRDEEEDEEPNDGPAESGEA